MGCIYTNEILFSNKKKLTTAICYSMNTNFKNVMLNETSQRERSHIKSFNLYETARKRKSIETMNISVISWHWKRE